MTTITRMQKAAAHLEKMVAEIGADADPADVAEIQTIIAALRDTQRADIKKAVWASVLTVLKIKGDMKYTVANVLTEAEGKEF